MQPLPSSAGSAQRTLARRTLLLGAGALLAGCNLRPLYWTDDRGRDIRPELAAIEVRTPNDRLGQYFGNVLRDELNPSYVEAPDLYILEVALAGDTDDVGIQPDSTVTRFNYALIATARLRSIDSQETLYQTRVRRIASYNLVGAPFASLISEQDARERAATEVAQDLRTQIALFLRRQLSATT